MSLNGMNRLRFANAVIGGLLLSSGVLTTYLDTLGAARAVSVILAVFGLLQLVITDVLETVDRRTTAQTLIATPPVVNVGVVPHG